MPKLLQINSLVNKGSTGRIAENIGKFVIDNNWESYIIYGRASNPSISNTIKIGSPAEIGWHGLNSMLFDNHGLSSKSATENLIRIIKDLKPDIIQLHNLHGYYLNYQLLFEYLVQSNIPVVWTFHDCWPFTGHCSYFSDINCLKWKIECDSCPKIKNYPSSIWLDRSTSNFRLKKSVFNSLPNLTIVTVSHWLKQLVTDSFMKKTHIEVIHNGVDLSSFRPKGKSEGIRKKYGIGEDKIMLLGVATIWDSRKGWEDYISLRGVLPDKYIIVLVGVTEIQRLRLPSGILGIRRLENLDELASLYSSADIVLNLSYQESFGLTTVEGFACGTPVIAYNSTASPELVSPGTGMVLNPGNIEILVKSIKEIASKRKEEYSETCRKHAELNFDEQLRCLDYFNLYNKLLGKRG